MNRRVKIITIICFLLLYVITPLDGTGCNINTTIQSGGQGILNVADTGPITLDPALATEVDSASYIIQIFSGLVRFDNDMQLKPDIAYSWDRSTDGLVYTFHLRQDAKFHNSKTVTATDFKYSWERALSPAIGSLSAGSYLNDIVGADDMLNNKSTNLRGVTVVDNYTLQVSITTPVLYFLDKLAYPTAFVVDSANVNKGITWWQHPNGTGPFKLSKWQEDQILILSRNENYYGEKAKLDQVIFQLYSGDPVQLYEMDSIDVANVSSDYIGLVTDPENSISKELNIYPEMSLYYIGFNVKEPPFDDVNIRKAFCYAVDKNRIIELTTNGLVLPAYGILPQGIPGYNPDLQGLTFDPDKAKELIKSSKYGDISNLPSIIFTTSGWGGDISGIIGGVIEEWRQNLGVEIQVRQIEPEYFSYDLNREVDNLYDCGWIADYPDPQDFLDILFKTAQSNNIGGYSNTKLDGLLDEASVEENLNLRISLYQEAERIIVDEAVVLPLFFNRNYVLVKPYIEGYELSPLGFVSLSQVSINK